MKPLRMLATPDENSGQSFNIDAVQIKKLPDGKPFIAVLFLSKIMRGFGPTMVGNEKKYVEWLDRTMKQRTFRGIALSIDTINAFAEILYDNRKQLAPESQALLVAQIDPAMFELGFRGSFLSVVPNEDGLHRMLRLRAERNQL